MRKVPLDRELRCDVRALRRRIDRNTIALAGTAPDYPYGNFDPIPEIAALAQSRGIGCHSDCCLGSFANAFAEQAGCPLPHAVDFSVPGVTSISCDPHKYAYGPKGFSVCLFRDKALRQGQFFACMDWPGGFCECRLHLCVGWPRLTTSLPSDATTTIAGSRPGATIAGTWAAVVSIGQDGYVQRTRSILRAAERMRVGLAEEVPEVLVASRHHSSVVALVSRPGAGQINALALSDVLAEHFGWTLNKIQNPPGCHLAVTLPTATQADEFVAAVKRAVAKMKAEPELNHSASVATYGLAANLSKVDAGYVNDLCKLHSAALLDAL